MHIWDDVLSLLNDSDNVTVSYPLLLSTFGRVSLDNGQEIFDRIPNDHKDIVSIGLMMKYYIQNDKASDALVLYDEIDTIYSKSSKLAKDDGSHSLALKACIQCNAESKGMEIHREIEEYLKRNERVHLKTTLIEFYHHFGHHSVAMDLFESIPIAQRDAVCTSTMMKGLIDNGYPQRALAIYENRKSPQSKHSRDDICDTLAIKACIAMKDWRRGKEIHYNIEHLITDQKIHLKNILINFYGESGDIQTAQNIFDSIAPSRRDSAVINAMMKVLIHNHRCKEALVLYDSIHHFDWKHSKKWKTNHISHLMALRACTVSHDVERGKRIHSMIRQEEIRNIQIESALIDFYGNSGDIDSALAVFSDIDSERRNIISINAMMAAFNDNEYYAEALELYDDERYVDIERDGTTKMLAIKSCTNLREFERGIAIHQEIGALDSAAKSVVMKTTLIALYGHSGDLETAQRLFDSIEDDDKDIFVVDTLMEALCNNGQNAECIQMFDALNEPDVVSYVTALKAATNGTMLSVGKRIHEALKQRVDDRIWRHKNIQIHLINMYGKCAMLEECERILDEIKRRDIVQYRTEIGIWNAMVLAFGRNGDLKRAKRVYAMIRNRNDSELDLMIDADRKTFILMITACSHHGEVEEAMRIWNEDIGDETIQRDEYVMSALLDGMARKGMLAEVMELILRENHGDCKVMWMSLLSACRHHRNQEMTGKVFEEIKSRFPGDDALITSAGILLSNVMSSVIDYHASDCVQDV